MAIKGLISKASDRLPLGLKGHSGMKIFEIISPKPDGSMHLNIMLDEVAPGGKIDLHNHELTPPCDHAYYVISGEILARVGDKKEIVGSDALIYCMSNVVHSIENIGRTPAKLLRIGAAANGNTVGKVVPVKE
jgi:quercetin dioxygenase-like cupin family protein